jgi:hypothetical protein
VDNKLAIEAKRKKEFFGGGSGEFVNCVFSGNAELFTEDYFSQNQILISHSILDVAAKWPTCKTADVRFVDPAQANYVLDASSMAGNGLTIAQPDWLPHWGNGAAPKVPGIFGNMANHIHAQRTPRELGFAAGR